MFVDLLPHINFMSDHQYFKCLPKSESIYRKYYEEFVNRRIELNVESLDDALECIFKEWSLKYCAATLRTRLSGIIQIMRSEGLAISNDVYRNILSLNLNMQRYPIPPNHFENQILQ